MRDLENIDPLILLGTLNSAYEEFRDYYGSDLMIICDLSRYIHKLEVELTLLDLLCVNPHGWSELNRRYLSGLF